MRTKILLILILMNVCLSHSAQVGRADRPQIESGSSRPGEPEVAAKNWVPQSKGGLGKTRPRRGYGLRQIGAPPFPDSLAQAIATADSTSAAVQKKARFQVYPITAVNSKHTDIIGCAHAHQLYFYSRAPKIQLGHRQGIVFKKRPFALYAITAGIFGDRSEIQVASKLTHESQKSLGITWDHRRNLSYVARSTNVDGREVTRIYCSRISGAGQVVEELIDLKSDAVRSDFHPCLSPDGQMLVFASERGAGYGGTDLYCARLTGGAWSVPENLGPLVNTRGNDNYPSFNAAGVLYYSSDSLPGFGKTDIYCTELRSYGWAVPINAGFGINSAADDFGLVWDDPEEGSRGYFTSNRSERSGCDIYAFSRQPEFWGQVVAEESHRPLRNARVQMRVVGMGWEDVALDWNGNFFRFLDAGRDMEIFVEADGYAPQNFMVKPALLLQGADLRFEITLVPYRRYELNVSVLDSASGKPLDSVVVELRDKLGGQVLHGERLENSIFSRELAPGADYVLMLRRKGYRSVSIHLPLAAYYGQKNDQRTIAMVPKNEMLLVGFVMDSAGKPLAGRSRIDIMDMDRKEVLMTLETTPDGGFGAWLDRLLEGRISIFASHDGHATDHIYRYEIEDQYFPIFLRTQNLGFEVPAMRIYYEMGQTRILGNQAELIDDIYFYMLRNPEVHLELRTYTDATGTATLNDEIARKRSAAIMTELVLRGGIDIGRINRRDYGETHLLNDCVDGVDCPEVKHLENRRTEVYFFRPELQSARSVN